MSDGVDRVLTIDEVKDYCIRSMEFLATQILDYKDWDVCHDEVNKFLARPSKKKALLLPRGHLKTTLVTITKSIQFILRNPNIRILIANQVWDRSRDILREIKGHLEGGKLPAIFGSFQSGRWTEDAIIVKGRKKSLKEPTIATTGIESETTGGHYDVIFLDDLIGLQNSGTAEQREKAKRFRRSMINLLEPGGKVIEVGCLVGGSKVLMADGRTKPIEEILIGEKVISHDSVEVVEAMIPQGMAEVFELKTRNGTIEATENHPFLTERGFVRLDELKLGDEVYMRGTFEANMNGVDADEMYALGFMYGDGWLTENPNSKGSMRYVVCFAKKKDEEKNKRMVSFFKNKFGVNVRSTDNGYYRIDSNPVGRWLKENGFEGKAKTKRVPGWVFSRANAMRESFLSGILNSDGFRAGSSGYGIELSNEGLIDDVKNLAEGLGRKVSNVHTRERMIKAPHSPTNVLSKTHHVTIGNVVHKERWLKSRIISIKPTGRKFVYDLTISNTHNFVANGFVVHNTRWHLDDTFAEIFEKEADYYDVMVKKVVDEDGTVLFPKKFSQVFDTEKKTWKVDPTGKSLDYIEYLKKSLPPAEYSAQYLNEPIDEENQIFKPSYFNYYTGRKDDLYRVLTVDLAIAEGKVNDKTAMVVTGMSNDRKIYVLDYLAGKWPVHAIIENLFDMQRKWSPNAVGLETTGFQRVLKWALEREMGLRRIFFPIEELRSPIVGNAKEMRIKSLEPFYRRGDVFHHESMRGRELETQLTTFPRGKHDDTIDALSYALQLLLPGREGVKEEAGYMSGDWWLNLAHRGQKDRNFFNHG